MKTLYTVGNNEMSLHVEGSLGTLSFFGILCISAPFHAQGTLPLSTQVLNMLLRWDTTFAWWILGFHR